MPLSVNKYLTQPRNRLGERGDFYFKDRVGNRPEKRESSGNGPGGFHQYFLFLWKSDPLSCAPSCDNRVMAPALYGKTAREKRFPESALIWPPRGLLTLLEALVFWCWSFNPI
jgi:hypothetical protein